MTCRAMPRVRFIPAGAGNTHAPRIEPVCVSVHPRGCGEHLCSASLRLLAIGSSPRVRGTPQPCGNQLVLQRFIPAGAGNTPAGHRRRRVQSVHPRGCGEHSAIVSTAVRPIGSSPRVRGTPWGPPAMPAIRRFIPAGAGNTASPAPRARQRPVHPRGCGEHGLYRYAVLSDGGSSPRVRGTHQQNRRPVARLRFIPAGAGNTLTSPRSLMPLAVHPRGCGEHNNKPTRRRDYGGSSPRVRGTLDPADVEALIGRFIPAGAGNTSGRRGQPGVLPVHPRGCGEHLRRLGAVGPDSRFIPAGAGNTCGSMYSSQSSSVHPRGCGEHGGSQAGDSG